MLFLDRKMKYTQFNGDADSANDTTRSKFSFPKPKKSKILKAQALHPQNYDILSLRMSDNVLGWPGNAFLSYEFEVLLPFGAEEGKKVDGPDR